MRVRVLASTALLALVALAPALPVAAVDGPPEPVIVLLRKGDDVDATVARVRRGESVRATHSFRHALRGFAAELTPGQAARLRRDPSVDAIVPDAVVELAAQSVPPGVRRAGAVAAPATKIDGIDAPGDRVDADIAIIDTGIQPNHPDLNVVGGVNCTTSDRSDWADKQGHGTHVAGTAAAIDNSFGVVGSAPGARLWSVRVFDANAFSRISWIVCGIDWVTAQRDPADPDGAVIEVVNMSLRDEGGDDHNCGYTVPDAEHRAICASVAAGTTYVVAAGNDRTVSSRWRPAAYDEVITVSAIADFDGLPGGLRAATCTSFGGRDGDDTFADFSNFGGDVDIAAPGVCIRSTIRGSSYGTISGTSMASPLVAGAAAVYRSLHPLAAQSEVRSALRAAGSDAWFQGTDRDSTHEPLLDMSSFGAPPGFRLRATPATAAVWSGYGHTGMNLVAVRGNGFQETIDLSVEGLPPEVEATFSPPALAGWATGPVRLEIRAPAGLAAGVHEAAIVARSGDLEERRPLTVEVLVDAAPPVAATPRLSIVAPATMSASSIVLRSAWSATDVGTGIAAYEHEELRDAGSFAGIPLSPATVTSRTLAAAPATALTHQVRATDRVGNVGEWATGPATQLAGFSEATSLARWSSRWTTRSLATAWGGRTRFSGTAGASVTFRFTGSSVAWVTTLGPTRGAARLYLDGVLVRTIDLRASTTRYRQVVFARDVAYGAHSLKVVVVGTPGRSRVDVDGFLVLRRP